MSPRKTDSKVVEAPIVDHPSFYALPPKQQLYVELVRGYMSYHGKVGADVAKELARTAEAAAEAMGWE